MDRKIEITMRICGFLTNATMKYIKFAGREQMLLKKINKK